MTRSIHALSNLYLVTRYRLLTSGREIVSCADSFFAPMCLLLCISPFPLTYAGRDAPGSIRRRGHGPDPRMVLPGEACGTKSVTQPLAPAFLGTNDDQRQIPALQPRSGWVRVTIIEF